MDGYKYKLYVGPEELYFESMEQAQSETKKHIEKEDYLRIEVLVDLPLRGADWWAYNKTTNQWEPS